jgi:hypothetical protein
MVSLPSWVSWISVPLARSLAHRSRERTNLAKPPLG